MIWNYFKTAIRNFYRNRLYSLINMVGLSIGLACCLVVFLFVRDEYSFDRFHENIDSIYRLNTHLVYEGKEEITGSTSAVMGPTLKAEIPEFQSIIRIRNGSTLIRTDKDIIRESFLFVDESFFEHLNFPFIEGNADVALSDPNGLVIDKELANKYFGEDNPIGKYLEMELGGEFQTMEVVGLMEEMPTNSSIGTSMILPFSKYEQIVEKRRLTNWFDLQMTTLVVLNETADSESIFPKLQVVMKEHNDSDEMNASFSLEPFKSIHLNDRVRVGNGLRNGSDPSLSWILSSIGLLILLIACINYTNLSMGVFLSRVREIGMRKVVGAEKKQLIFQFLGEAALMTVIAFAFSILLVDLSLPVFNSLTSKELVLFQGDNFSFIIAVVLLLILTTFLSGGYPSFVVSSFGVVKALKGNLKIVGRNWVSRALVVFQFGMAVFLIVCLMIIQRQMKFIENYDLGYNDKDLVGIYAYGEDGNKLLNRFQQKFAEDTDVKYISAYTDGSYRTDVEINGRRVKIFHERIAPNFFDAFEIDKVSGRFFSSEFGTDSISSIIVNEAFVKEAELTDPIGTVVQYDYYDNMNIPTIVGVVEDCHFVSFHQKVKPVIFHINPQARVPIIWAKIDEQKVESSLAKLETTWKEFVPYRPFQYYFLEDSNESAYRAENQLRLIITYASIAAIFIACLGLFALAGLHIHQRTKEIGIRKVLGASVYQLIIVQGRHFILLVGLAIGIAFPVAYFIMNNWISTFAYQTSFGVSPFLLAASIVLSIAILTISYHALKTARANPIKALRDE